MQLILDALLYKKNNLAISLFQGFLTEINNAQKTASSLNKSPDDDKLKLLRFQLLKDFDTDQVEQVLQHLIEKFKEGGGNSMIVINYLKFISSYV